MASAYPASPVPILSVFLAAEEAAGARALGLVVGAGHRIAGVLTADRRYGGAAGTAASARRAGVPIIAADEVDDETLAGIVRRERVDLLLNVHSLRILPPDVLALPTIGCFNLHPGPLPGFAGLNAPSWAIYEGATRYGCSLHWMTPEVDAGPVAYSAEFDVDPRDTGLSLTLKCVRHGLPLLEQLLEDAAASGRAAIPADEQPKSKRRYLRRGPPSGGYVPWAEPATRVDALVRACTFDPFPSPWGAPVTCVDGTRVSIRRASLTQVASETAPGTIGDRVEGGIRVAARDEWVLVEELEIDGVRAAPATVLRLGRRCEPAATVEQL
jgi:methionyl-tRNA formyltransferase